MIKKELLDLINGDLESNNCNTVYKIDVFSVLIPNNINTNLFTILETEDNCITLRAVAIVPTIPITNISPTAEDLLRYFLNGEANLYYTNNTFNVDISCICSIQKFSAVINDIPANPIALEYILYIPVNDSNITNNNEIVIINSNSNPISLEHLESSLNDDLLKAKKDDSCSTIEVPLIVYNPNLIDSKYEIIGEIIKPKEECIFELDRSNGIITLNNCLNCVGTYQTAIRISSESEYSQIIPFTVIVDTILVDSYKLYRNETLVDSDTFSPGVFSFEVYDLSNTTLNPFYQIDITLDDLLDFDIVDTININSTNPNFIVNNKELIEDGLEYILRLTFQMLNISGESLISFSVVNENGIIINFSFYISVSNEYT